tara:strand:- start:886 stop:1254 length:369 start_codon:yes stop_codon:yes gene_type:complete
MESIQANVKINDLISALEKGFDGEKAIVALTEIRELALKETDPLLVKVTRLAYEYIKENNNFNYTVEKVDRDYEEEEEEELMEPGTDSENLTYLMQLIKKSDNEINREEIKEMRTWLKSELY